MNFYGKLRPERKSGAVLRATRHSAQLKSRGGDDEDMPVYDRHSDGVGSSSVLVNVAASFDGPSRHK